MKPAVHRVSPQSPRSGHRRAFLSASVILLALCFSARLATSAPIRQGNPFVPAGANFHITGLQGIDAAHAQGESGNSQVNTNFEFTPSIGVTYDTGNGALRDFGLGLYSNAAKQTQSTGLQIQYNAPVNAASVTITVEDFDLKSGATGFDYAKKVAPIIKLLGPGNTILGSFSPTDIFPVMVEQPLAGGKKGSSDIWDISFADLLSSLHIADTPITGFILAADMANGETPNSDPYLLLSVGNGVNVPEPATLVLLAAGGILFVGWSRRR